jgi:hypothetical protein
MMTYRVAAASLLFALLSACVTYVPAPLPKPLITDPAQASAMTRVTRDEYKKMTKFEGANASQYNSLYLRGWRDDRTKVATFQIYATSFYGDQWRFYGEAYDSDGNRLEFISIERKVDSCDGARGCYYRETVGLNISRKYLEDHQETGIRYKVSGKAGDFTGFLPAAYVKGFLLSVDRAT